MKTVDDAELRQAMTTLWEAFGIMAEGAGAAAFAAAKREIRAGAWAEGAIVLVVVSGGNITASDFHRLRAER